MEEHSSSSLTEAGLVGNLQDAIADAIAFVRGRAMNPMDVLQSSLPIIHCRRFATCTYLASDRIRLHRSTSRHGIG